MTDRKIDNLGDVVRMVREVFAANKKDLRSVLYRDIILNALKCKRDELDMLDLKVINRALAEFRHAACVFKPYRTVRKVSIFGSARVARRSPYYQLAVELGRLLVENGFMVITGAAEGIMRPESKAPALGTASGLTSFYRSRGDLPESFETIPK